MHRLVGYSQSLRSGSQRNGEPLEDLEQEAAWFMFSKVRFYLSLTRGQQAPELILKLKSSDS